MEMRYFEEEKHILDALKNGKMKLSSPLKKEIEAIKTAADNTLRKDRRITIRLYDHDLIGIQKKAIKMGIPYQTLISGIIHRYVEGDLKIKAG
jgi:predicted DNA binding CopG/RHH family protein